MMGAGNIFVWEPRIRGQWERPGRVGILTGVNDAGDYTFESDGLKESVALDLGCSVHTFGLVFIAYSIFGWC